MPKNKIGRHMMSKLKLYVGATHPHQAQQPILLEPMSGRPAAEGKIEAPKPKPKAEYIPPMPAIPADLLPPPIEPVAPSAPVATPEPAATPEPVAHQAPAPEPTVESNPPAES